MLLPLHHSARFHVALPDHCMWDGMPEQHTVHKEVSTGQGWGRALQEGTGQSPSPPAMPQLSTAAAHGQCRRESYQQKASLQQSSSTGRSPASSLERRCSKRLVPWFYLQSTHKKLTDRLGVFYRAGINFLLAVKRNEETKGSKCICPCPPVSSV